MTEEQGGEAIARLLQLAALAVSIWGLWLAGTSTLLWLKTGVWNHLSITEAVNIVGWHPRPLGWVVIDRAVQWVGRLPAFAALWVAAGWVAHAVEEMMAADEAARRERAYFEGKAKPSDLGKGADDTSPS